MFLSSELKEKIRAKIRNLNVKRSDLYEKLHQKREFNSQAWNQYGSELCGLSMLDEELKISNEADEATNQMNLLEDYILGKIDIVADEEKFSAEMRDVDRRLTALMVRKVDLTKILNKIAEAKKDIF